MKDLSLETRTQIAGWLEELLDTSRTPASELSEIQRQDHGVKNLLTLMLPNLNEKLRENQIPNQFVRDNLDYFESRLATKIEGILSGRRKLIETALDVSLSNGNRGLRKDAYDLLHSLRDIEAIKEIVYTLEERNEERKKKTLPEPVDQFLLYARGKALGLKVKWSSRKQSQVDALTQEVEQELERAVISRPPIDPSVSEQDTQKMPIITSLQVFQQICFKVPLPRLKRLLRENNSLALNIDMDKFIQELTPQQAVNEIDKTIDLLNARLRGKNELILSITLQDLDSFAQSGVDISPALDELLNIARNSKDYFYRKKALSALFWQAKNEKKIPNELLVLATEIYTNIEDLGDCPHVAYELLKARVQPETLEKIRGIKEAKLAELREPTEELVSSTEVKTPVAEPSLDQFNMPWQGGSNTKIKVSSASQPQPLTPKPADDFSDWPDAPEDKFDAMLQRQVELEKAARKLQEERERVMPIQEKMIVKLSSMNLKELESQAISNQYEEVCISAVGRITNVDSLKRISENARFESVKEIAKDRIAFLTAKKEHRLGTVSKIALAACLAFAAFTFSSDAVRRMFSGEPVNGNPETVRVIFVEKAPESVSVAPELGVKVEQKIEKVAPSVQEAKKETVKAKPALKPVQKLEKPKPKVEPKKEVKEPPKIKLKPVEKSAEPIKVAQVEVPLETLDDVLSYELNRGADSKLLKNDPRFSNESAAPFQDKATTPEKVEKEQSKVEPPVLKPVQKELPQPEKVEIVQVQPELAPTVDSQPNPLIDSQDTDEVAAGNARIVQMQRTIERALEKGEYTELNRLLRFKTSEGHAGRWVKWQDNPKNDDYSVTAVQLLLRNLGYTDPGNHVEVTGQYDEATERAVRDLQKKMERSGIKLEFDGDGKFGKETWKALKEFIKIQKAEGKGMLDDYMGFKGKFASGAKTGERIELKGIDRDTTHKTPSPRLIKQMHVRF